MLLLLFEFLDLGASFTRLTFADFSQILGMFCCIVYTKGGHDS